MRDRFPGYHFSGADADAGRAGQSADRRPPTANYLRVVARPTDSVGTRGPGPDVTVVAEDGPDAGRLAPLPRSGLTVGRNHAEWLVTDPYLSAPHFRLEVDAEGVLITGTEVAQRPARSIWTGDQPYTAGSSTFRLVRGRPEPLSPLRSIPDAVVDPGPEPARPNAVLQAIMAAGPLVIGVVMAVVTGLWYFLLFSLVSVAVVAVMWFQHRAATRRHGRRIRDGAERISTRLDDLAPTPGRLALAARAQNVDRFGVHGAPTEGPVIRWGTGTARLRVETAKEGDQWDRWSTVDLPATSVLLPGRTTVVTGRPSTLQAMGKWLHVQLCRDAVATGRGVVIRTPQGDTSWGGGQRTAAGTIVCWPGTSVRDLPAGWHRVQLSATGPQGHPVAPGSWTPGQDDRVHADQGVASLTALNFTALRWHGMTARTADWLLDEMAEAHRPGLERDPIRLALPEPLMEQPAVESLRAALSSGKDPVTIDLVAHGPHLLVAGTTGSGKSELLLALLTGLAAAHPPTEVSFVLMDFKGGSSFAVLAGLPHTMSVETNLAEAESLRTFDALSAELRRREELFLAAGAADFRAYRHTHPNVDLPRLVVAIDELRVLVDDHPQAAALLARLAATGRSLGFHLVLSTQRAQGAVGPDIRSNLGTVICLRTATEQESWDLLGTADAVTIAADAPGSAYLRHGGGPTRPFQAGQFSVATGPPALVRWTDGEPDADPAPWRDLTVRIGAEAACRSLPVPTRAVMPALPEKWTPTPEDRSVQPEAAIVGLADLHHERAQRPVRWWPGRDGPVAWIGTTAGGVDAAARTVLDHLARMDPAASTFVLDGNGAADSLGVPESWDVIAADRASPQDLAELLERMRGQLADRHRVHLVVTAWGRWSAQRVGTSYETVDEHLATLLRDHGPDVLAAALFGARELAGGRILGLVPTRFYLPAGSTPEHRMVWPTLQRVKEVPGRAVMISPDRPAPGVAVQLAAAV
ncbi:FtsK/SpoIIIE domain-containing protein [Citricoccus sp.]|uniref:FtsK/SpoIIIE domain-containing protein n=1 Tax=Citricoccus sp. TaxID=1978372 RepID=UPI0028BEB1C4|nr:FtsK/SpoIIIE domain-containing protein [Citricoccus sp.]